MNAKNLARMLSCFAVLLAALPGWTNAAPIVVGPGASSSIYTGGDGSGGRTNIDLNVVQTLGPGVYRADIFDVTTTTSGKVIPFLAQFNGPSTSPGNNSDLFQVLAFGNSDAVGTGVHTAAFAFGGSNTFTLATTTTIYAGVTDDPTQNPISSALGFKNGGLDDHNNSGGPLAGGSFAPSVGGIVPGFSNGGLGRTYGFDVQITQLPEPSSFILGGLGVVGLFFAARRRRKAVAALCVLMALALGSATSAQATPITIGLGPNGGASSTDDSGTRINVDLAHAMTLGPGTYTVTNFDFTVAGTGNAQPFLAVVASGTPGSSAIYDPIAVGNNVDITSFTSLTTSHTAFGGSNTFTLVSPTTVYAGVSNISGGPNPVGFIDPGGSIKQDDHSNPAQSLTVGTDLTVFTNYGLPREYAFSITTTPEPSSFILGGLGVVGLLIAARRRRKA